MVPGLQDYERVEFNEPRADYYWTILRARTRDDVKRLEHTKVDQGFADVVSRLAVGDDQGRAALRAVVEYTADPEEKAEALDSVRFWLYPYGRHPDDFQTWLQTQAGEFPTVAQTLRAIADQSE